MKDESNKFKNNLMNSKQDRSRNIFTIFTHMSAAEKGVVGKFVVRMLIG